MTIPKILSKFNVIRNSDAPPLVRFIPESYALRFLTGGGFILGSIYVFCGREGSGKSTLALKLIGERMKSCEGDALLIDNECSLGTIFQDREHIFGVDRARLVNTSYIMSLEEVVDLIPACVSQGFHTIVLDSVKECKASKILDEDYSFDDKGIGAMAADSRLWSAALTRIEKQISLIPPENRPLIIFLDQLRMNLGGYIPTPEPSGGGRAMRHHAAAFYMMTPKKGENYISVKNIVKARGVAPHREARLGFDPLAGFDTAMELFDMAKEFNAFDVVKSGGNFYLNVAGQEHHFKGQDAVVEAIRTNPQVAEALIKRME